MGIRLITTVSCSAILATTVAGCGADAQNQEQSQNFTELYSGEYLHNGSFTNKSTEIIGDQSTLEMRVAHYTSEPVAEVDFSDSRVLLVDMGQRPTGGFAIAVTSAKMEDGHVIAEVTLSQPGVNCAVTEALTNPYQFVKVATTQEILIQERLVTDVCN